MLWDWSGGGGKEKSQIMFSANYTYCVRQRRDENDFFSSSSVFCFAKKVVGIKTKRWFVVAKEGKKRNWNEQEEVNPTQNIYFLT